MDYKYFLVAYPREGIAQITINRPEVLNALSLDVVYEFCMILDMLESNNSVRVAILTGAGRAFIAGADIAYMKNLGPDAACEWSLRCGSIGEKIRTSRIIYIAAVNGFAFGAGCEIALASDLVIASDNAKFSLPEVGLGILPGAGGTQRLCYRAGMQKAKEMILTGMQITAHDAVEYGIVLRVTSIEGLLDEAFKLADKILTKPPVATKYAKACMQYSEELILKNGLNFENIKFGMCFADKDQEEGMSAFLEKRKPNFSKSF